jgi:thiol:disulfide interchange protein DsbC
VASFFKKTLLPFLFFLSACTTQTPTKEVVTASIKKIMPPNFEVVGISPLKEMPGLFEVSVKMDKQPVVLYMDKNAQYVISGSLLNVETKKNLTVEAQGKIK